MSVSSSPPSSPLSEKTGWSNRTCTPCSACFRHTLKLLYCLSTSSRPPEGTEEPSPMRSAQSVWRTPRLVTHAAAGSAVVPPPGESVEWLRAFHAHAHFMVSDPAGGTAAKFLCLENTCAAVYPNFCTFNIENPLLKHWLVCVYLSKSQPEGLIFLLKRINCFLNFLQMKGNHKNKAAPNLKH